MRSGCAVGSRLTGPDFEHMLETIRPSIRRSPDHGGPLRNQRSGI